MITTWQVALVPSEQAARIDLDLGSGLRLHLAERRIADRPLDRGHDIQLLGAAPPSGLVGVRVQGTVGDHSIDVTFEPGPDLHYAVDPGRATPPTKDPTSASIRVGWQFERRGLLPTRTRWWDRSVLLEEWDARGAGLSGFTPSDYHRLEPESGTMWTGTGRRLSGVILQPARSPRARRIGGLDSGDIVAFLDARAHVFTASGHLKRTVDVVRGRVLASFEHDVEGRLTGWADRAPGARYDVRYGESTVITAPGGQWVSIVSDDAGRASSLSQAVGAPISISYSEHGLIAASTGPRGQTVEIEHDEKGALTTWRHSAGRRLDLHVDESAESRRVSLITATGREFTTIDELVGAARRRTQRCCGATGATVTTKIGGATTVHRPDGSSERTIVSTDVHGTQQQRRTIRTPAGRTSTTVVSQEEHNDGFEISTRVDGRIWRRTYDRRAGLLRTTAPSGRVDEIVVNGDSGLRVRRAGRAEVLTEFVGSRPVRMVDGGREMSFEHDEDGRLTAVVDGDDRREVHHDAAGRVVAMQLSTGWIRISHDDAGDVIDVTTPNGAVSHIERAPDGLIDALIGPDNGAQPIVVRLGYDEDRQLASRSVERGATTHYRRDAAGRLRQIKTDDVTIDIDVEEESGIVTSVSSDAGPVVAWVSDGPLLVEERTTGPVEGTVERRYGHGFLPEAIAINGVELPIRRDADGATAAIGPVAVERGANGLVETVRVGSTVTTRTFDEFGGLVTNRTTAGSTVVFDETIVRDAQGRVIEITETDPAGTRTRTYRYRGDGLVATEVDGRSELALTRDANGNTLRFERWGEESTATVDAADSLTAIDGRPTTSGPAGELLDDGTHRYSFDALGRLNAIDGDGAALLHLHDGLGRLVRSTADASSYLEIVWNGPRPAVVRSADGISRICVATNEGSAPEALIDGESVLRLVTDHRGSVRAVIDAESGEEQQRLDYDPLGQRTLDTSPGFQPFGFAGGLHDPYSGLVHLGRRVLDPRLGRFLTMDPLGLGGGQINPYAYAGNDPVNRHDPTGTQSSSSGRVQVCTAPFLGDRPFSADHTFLETPEWSRGSTFGPEDNGVERIMQEWVDEKTHPKGSANNPEKECQPVENVDEECLNNFTRPGIGTGPYGFGLKFPTPFSLPVEINMCASEVWDALDACAGPGGWEYSNDVADRVTGEGPGAFDSAVRWARNVANYPETIWDWATN